MKLKALDSFCSSGIGMVHAGQEFTVTSDARGEEFIAKGLAVKVKMEEPPQNKMEAAPKNKGKRHAE